MSLPPSAAVSTIVSAPSLPKDWSLSGPGEMVSARSGASELSPALAGSLLPRSSSAPVPPLSVSPPAKPNRSSLPVLPEMTSFWSVPSSRSLPDPPSIVAGSGTPSSAVITWSICRSSFPEPGLTRIRDTLSLHFTVVPLTALQCVTASPMNVTPVESKKRYSRPSASPWK
jgi:hypothetical protein